MTCERCGTTLETLHHPVRRLRWTRYWWRGWVSLFTGPMYTCPQCGAMHSSQGQLIAAGAVQTAAEQQLDQYRRDMAYVRDSFAGVIIAAELVAVWLLAGPVSATVTQIVASAAVGVAAIVPYAYFSRKAHRARRDLKKLRQARRAAALPEGPR